MINEVLDRRAPGIAGQPASLRGDSWTRSMVNDRPRTAQVDTITASAVNDATYTVTIDGIDITYLADGDATAAEIVAGLTLAVNSEPAIAGKLLAAVASSTTLTLTSRIGGLGFTTVVGANLSLAATTANDTSDAIAFGAACLEVGQALCGVADSSSFPTRTADVGVLTPVVQNSTAYQVGIRNKSTGQVITVQFTSDSDATAQEIVEGLATVVNAAMPAETVIATEDDAVLTLTAEDVDYRFEVVNSGNLTLVFAAGNGGTDESDLADMFAGCAVRDLGKEQPVSGSGIGYEGGSNCSIMSRGDIWVTTTAQAAIGSDVYVCVSGADKGKFRASAAANYVKLPRSRARWERVHSASLAVLSLV